MAAALALPREHFLRKAYERRKGCGTGPRRRGAAWPLLRGAATKKTPNPGEGVPKKLPPARRPSEDRRLDGSEGHGSAASDADADPAAAAAASCASSGREIRRHPAAARAGVRRLQCCDAAGW